MKCITFGIGYLLAALVVDVSSADYYFLSVYNTTHNGPYNFGYSMESNSLLIMEITLKNIPQGVTAVTVIQLTYDASRGSYSTTELKVNFDEETREGKFMILIHLRLNQILVYVELLNRGRLCTGTRITEGRSMTPYTFSAYYWNTTQKAPVHYYYINWKHDDSGDCLAPKACEVILDLKDKCKEQPKSTYGNNFECHLNKSQYNCMFVRDTKNYQELVLSQVYEDDTIVGPALKIKPHIPKLSIQLELELFDNNTLVKLAPTWADTLNITAKDITKASNVTKLKYTNTTDVQFSCEQNKYRPIVSGRGNSLQKFFYYGFINTTDNKIKTLNTTITKIKKFMMADNGTILCCIVYVCKINSQGISMTRFVENKTLLIYQSQESTSTNLTESEEQRKAPCLDMWWLYVLLTLLGTIILLLTIYIAKKQRWCTNSQPAEETVELDNYATTNQVLYANLDLVHNESRPGNQTEESPYANIIGVLNPF